MWVLYNIKRKEGEKIMNKSITRVNTNSNKSQTKIISKNIGWLVLYLTPAKQ